MTVGSAREVRAGRAGSGLPDRRIKSLPEALQIPFDPAAISGNFR
jgi:hypothetical protein